VIPTDSPEALISYLRTVVGLKVTLTHAGTMAVKPKHKLTAEIRKAIDSVGMAAILAALKAERMSVERAPEDTRPKRPGRVTDLMQDAQAVWAIIRNVNDPPRLFRRSGIAWIESDDEGRPGAVHLDTARLTHYLAGTVFFVAERTIGDVVAEVAVPPPSGLVRDLLATPDPPLPVLARIITAPVVTRTGAIHERPGYDPGSRAVYAPPPGFVVPPVEDRPDGEALAAARERLLEAVNDFPFVGPADRAHTLAAILTPFARDLITGPTPLFLFNKPAPGTGASLLVGAIAHLVTGVPAEAMSEARDDEEWRKRLTSMLRPAPAVVVLDNLTGTLSSGALSTALTAIVWKDRALGSNEEIKVPVRCLWLATGNNVKLTTDLARRTVAVRLDAKVERPWLRARHGVQFRHPDLLAWVGRERAQLVHAALTLVRAWLAAGQPAGPETLGMYEAWCRVVGGILHVAGVPGFLANLDDLYESSDLDADETRRFIAAWWEGFHDSPKPPAELFTLANSEDVALSLSGQTEHARRVSLGKYLERHLGRPYAVEDGLNLTITKLKGGGRPLWRLTPSNGHRRGESGVSGECFLSTHARTGNPNGVQIIGGESAGAERLSPHPRLSRAEEWLE
jgi:hypothetical protein